MTVARQPVPAVIVPDAGAWMMWGRDLSALGFRSAAAPEQADVLIGPARVPQALAEAVRAAWALQPAPRRHVALGDTLADGASLAEVVEAGDGPRHTDGTGGDHGDMDHGDMDHGDMDHGDMMAITGAPSADGLVMEDVDVELGPLLSPLPGGLRARVSLDGDVVASCAIDALLRASAGSLAPDPGADRAWTAAFALARGTATGWGPRLAAVETERALSHLVWLRRLGELLGWSELADRAGAAVAAVLPRHRDPEAPLGGAHAAAGRLANLLDGSRRLRARTRGLAVVASGEVGDRGLAGPNALASEEAGRDGDALARVLVRAEQATEALRAADRLRGEDPPAPTAVDGPRGPVRVETAPIGRPLALRAPGAAEALEVAAERAVGLEWSRALVVLHSFDPSPWRVGG